MLVVEKARRISVHVYGTGVKLLIRDLRKIYPALKVSHVDEAVDITTTAWWKKMESSSHPGMVLWTYRDNAGLTLEQLSKLSGIAKSHLSDMENGKRTIGSLTAKKLATALKVDYRLLL
jgi:predicted transcriptional regulator